MPTDPKGVIGPIGGNVIRLALRRLRTQWRLSLGVFLGLLAAITLVAGAPVYLGALDRQGLAMALSSAGQRFSPGYLDVVISLPFVSLDAQGLTESDVAVSQAARPLGPAVAEVRQRLRTAPFLVALPRRSGQEVRGRGYLQYLEGLEDHVRLVAGRWPRRDVFPGPQGPLLEAALARDLAAELAVAPDDVVILTPSQEDPVRLSVRVTGLIEPMDPGDPFWRGQAGALLGTEAPEEGEEGPTPLALQVSREALVGSVGRVYPAAQVSATWTVFVDAEGFQGWTGGRLARAVEVLEAELARLLPGATPTSGLRALAQDLERRRLLASIPVLLLLTVMVATLLYFLFMVVSQLSPEGDRDAALLRGRGGGLTDLSRLYLWEGGLLVLPAAMAAPLLAAALVSLAGRTSYLRGLTGGQTLPVALGWPPFALAAGAAAVCMAVLVLPRLWAARSAQVAEQRRRRSRPPTVPFFQRYFLDVVLVVLGGLLFWELRARGGILSGGPSGEGQVNEAMLVAPLLFLVAVALLFFRAFSLVVRYLGGESPALVHYLVVLVIGVLTPAHVLSSLLRGEPWGWTGAVASLALLAAAYRYTATARRRRLRAVGLALQATAVALYLRSAPPETGGLLFLPWVGVLAVVPAQLLFLLLRWASRRAPVWVSVTLWHMARDPLRYGWLVLLLVLAAGVGVLAATVGGTLDRSGRERLLYRVASDVRVMDLPGYQARDVEATRGRYASLPGVEGVSLALRARGTIGGGPAASGRFQLLAVEPDRFAAWFREDFSDAPLAELMDSLRPAVAVEPPALPEGATRLAVWVRPGDTYPLISLWMVLEDRRGRAATVTFGPLGPPEWHALTAPVPEGLEPPLRLRAIELYEPGFGASGSPGSVLLDDVVALVGDGPQGYVVEDFEELGPWAPIVTSALSQDRLATVEGRRGRALALSFGRETSRGVRGIYVPPTGGDLPAVVSPSFLAAAGARRGERVVVEVMGGLVALRPVAVARYFPTLDPAGAGFAVTALDGLRRTLRILGTAVEAPPNEAFLSVTPGREAELRQALADVAPSPRSVLDRAALLEGHRRDPLSTAGWRALLALSLGVVVFAGGVGYVVYLLAFAERTQGEVGALRSMGLSRPQTFALLGLEHSVMVLVGLGLGSWAGFQMSRLTVSAVITAETGGRVLPPALITTQWAAVVAVFLALALLFGATLYGVVRGAVRMDLRTLSRLEN